MCAITIVWTLSGAGAVNPTPAQLALLRRLGAERRVLTFELPSWRRLRVRRGAGRAPHRASALDDARRRRGHTIGRCIRSPSIPAGRYRLRPRSPAAAGWLMVGVGRDQFSIRSGPLTAPPAPILLDFPSTSAPSSCAATSRRADPFAA